MKTLLVIYLFFGGPLSHTPFVEQGLQPGYAAVVRTQANEMGKAFIGGDYQTFVRYTYPQLVKVMGGEMMMMAQLKKMSDDMKAQGMSCKRISFGDVSPVVKSQNELQCTLSQQTEIVLASGGLITSSTLIAFSTDGGVRWTFMDTSNKDEATIRKLLPNLSRSIVIPVAKVPVRY